MAAASMSKRLLILTEDEPVTTRALALDLTEAGYRVATAADREEAIWRSRNERFDLLIATEQRGGAERAFVERFRRVLPAAKVVLMTTAALEAGPSPDAGEARVGKPFDLEDIRSVVERLLREERAS